MRSTSAQGYRPLPFAEGEGEGWGGVALCLALLRPLGNPLPDNTIKSRSNGTRPTLPCAARKGWAASVLWRSWPVCDCRAQFQLSTTLPALPSSISSKPFWKSSIGNWWVSTLPSGKPLSTSCVILYQVSYILRP